ncbi:MAG: hypothetical protein ACT4P4_28660 [Betaproteobacteria bacterium]
MLSGALRVWRISGTVRIEAAGAFLIVVESGAHLAVQHDGAEGWSIAMCDPVSGAQTPLGHHAGLPGLLRSLRAELAPDAPAGRLVIAS